METIYSRIVDLQWTIELYSENITGVDDLNVHYSKEHNRKHHPTLDATFDDMWKEICIQNKRLFNGSKFRFHAISLSNGKPEIEVGITDYKTYLCTNQSHRLNDLYHYGEKHYNNRQACLADPVAVNVVLETEDGFFVMIRRADWVGECKGMLDVPGGHAEPEELSKNHLSMTSPFDIDGKHVAYEIFHSIVREIRDELNIPENKISWPSLLGVVRTKILGGRPVFTFKASCDLDMNAIETLYSRGGLETDESTELIFVPIKELNLDESSNKWSVMVNEMSPGGQAAVYMYYYRNQKK